MNIYIYILYIHIESTYTALVCLCIYFSIHLCIYIYIYIYICYIYSLLQQTKCRDMITTQKSRMREQGATTMATTSKIWTRLKQFFR